MLAWTEEDGKVRERKYGIRQSAKGYKNVLNRSGKDPCKTIRFPPNES